MRSVDIDVLPPSKDTKRRKKRQKVRSVQRDYLLAVSDACPLKTFETIVRTTVDQAIEGEWRAREWLSKYLLPERPDLLREAAAEADGVSSRQVVENYDPTRFDGPNL